MELIDELREAAVSVLTLLLGGVGLSALIGHLISGRGGLDEALADRRATSWARQARIAERLPGTVPLGAIPRVRPELLDPAFSEPAMLAFVQRLMERVYLDLHAGRPLCVSITEGARESLAAGPRLAALSEVLPGQARLLATDRSPEWRTVDVEITGVLLERREGQVLPWRQSDLWRLRLRADLPLPDDEQLTALEPATSLWEILAVLDHERVRLDLRPPELPPWGPLSAPPEPGGDLEAQRALLLESLPLEARDLETWARTLTRALLEGPADQAEKVAMEPLSRALGGALAAESLCGRTLKVEELIVVQAIILDLRPHPAGLLWTAHLVVEARRWLEDAAGNALIGSRDHPQRGALELRVAWAGDGWLAWELRPARG